MRYPRSLLVSVTRPARYLGGEYNQPTLESNPGATVCLAYPDVYEVGMSYTGLVILYHLLNDAAGIRCERAFAPWPDMERELRERGLPLVSLETGAPLRSFDVVGFSLQYDLCFTNLLAMLDLGGIPLRSTERGESDPWVLGGGPCAVNPEPLADFVDAFCIGDGEEAILDIVRVIGKRKGEGSARKAIREALADVEGVYVPALSGPVYNTDGTLAGFEGRTGPVRRRIVDPETAYYPTRPLVPHLIPIHDRCTLEARRGCVRGCRFCQAGYITRPVRERLRRTLRRQADATVRATGDDEIGLLSLSIGDYSEIGPLAAELTRRFGPSGVSLSLPSLRVDGFDGGLAEEAGRVRRTSLTFAPEVGTEKMRRVVNKNLGRDDILAAIDAASHAGFDLVKLYFMVGLPLEDTEDVEGIADLVLDIRRFLPGKRKRLNVSVAAFVPKPHTPFHWCAQLPPEELESRMRHLRQALGRSRIELHYHDPRQSFLEAVFSRGDRRLGGVLARALVLGCRFDQWGDTFDYGRWRQAFQAEGLTPEFFALRSRERDEPFPWDLIDIGVTREFLWEEWERARACAATPDCTLGKCAACGVCGDGIRHTLAGEGRWQRPDAEAEDTPAAAGAGARSEETAGPPPTTTARLFLEYSRDGAFAYIGHLDFQRSIQKLFRRAGVPVAFTKGFNPHPRIAFALPLPVGEEAGADVLEAILDAEPGKIDLKGILASLNAAAPSGLTLTRAWEPDSWDPRVTALPQSVRYRVEATVRGDDSPGQAADRIRDIWVQLLERANVGVERPGKSKGETRTVDIRPFLSSCAVTRRGESELVLRFEFSVSGGRTVRVEDLLRILFAGTGIEVVRVVREAIGLGETARGITS